VLVVFKNKVSGLTKQAGWQARRAARQVGWINLTAIISIAAPDRTSIHNTTSSTTNDQSI
jgi:hypothetical protein